MVEFLIIAVVLGVLAWHFKDRIKSSNQFQSTPATPETSASQQSKTTDIKTADSVNTALEVATTEIEKAETISTTNLHTDEIAPKSPATIAVPEDSVLKRHHLAQIQAEKDKLSQPYPTDSVLRRHYDALHSVTLPAPTLAPIISKTENLAIETIPAPTPVAPTIKAEQSFVPEDSVLKRHFLSLLRQQVESKLPERPSDSVLKRHFDSLVDAELTRRQLTID